jgi:hypothetical protein
MTISASYRPWILAFLALATGLIFVEYLIVQSSPFGTTPSPLALGITLDLVLGIPALYYFLLVRKTKAAPITVLIVFLISVGLASLIVPREHQYFLNYAGKTLILAELGLLTFGIIQIRKVIRLYRAMSAGRKDFLLNLRECLSVVFGTGMVSTIVASEVAMLRYGLLFWIGKKEQFPDQPAFSIHKNSGYPTVWGVIVFVGLVEMVALHLLLVRWNYSVAIIATALSVYTLVLLIADLTAIIKRPILLEGPQLLLRIGIRWNALIDMNNIREVRTIKNYSEAGKELLDCALNGSVPNVLLELHKPVTVTGLYGMRRKPRRIALHVDDAQAFITAIRERQF